ncbi:MAG: NADH-quinone oxidoreductase subunit NuoG [Armatimonadetes bacterium]|nr:NADH-quinone oxidoreductase subunit NuoG [Armatimonadota bacterium]
MAVASNPETVEILINDIPVQVPKGELIVESVKRLGLEIPIFCYHPRMKPVGMCRMCLVEVGFKQPDGTVRKMPKPQAGCTLPADANMVVYTDSEMVHRDRKGVLEFLLVNHPLDCPICDRGGECPLQNNTLFYGPSTSRFTELKRHAAKAFPLSQYVTLDLERCIQCGRCVRFTEEISGDAELAFRFRGASMQPSTFELRDFGSKFSGNVIEICPVGALTNSKYRFRARPWDLETKPGICTVCSNGCNIWFDYRVQQMVRINGRANDAINEEWTCDKGKFGHEFYNSNERLTQPLMRQGGSIGPANWTDVYAEILKHFAEAGNAAAGIAGPVASCESYTLFKEMFAGFGSTSIDHRLYSNPVSNEIANAEKSSISSLESAKTILVFGNSLADDLPIIFLRVRKAWFKYGAKVIVAYSGANEVESFADVSLRYKPGTEEAVAKALSEAMNGALSAGVEAETGVAPSEYLRAAELLKGSGAPIISSAGLQNLKAGKEICASLQALAATINGRFNLYALGANEEGARQAGIVPGKGGKSVGDILKACKKGEIKALWILNSDLLNEYPDRKLVNEALESVEYLVYQGWEKNETTAYASVVVPMTAPAEEDGTYVNVDGTTQHFAPILKAREEARPAWRVFSDVMSRMNSKELIFSAAEIRERLAGATR